MRRTTGPTSSSFREACQWTSPPFKGFKSTPSLSAYTIYDHVSKKLTELNTERGYKDGWSALAEQKNVSLRYVFDAVASYDNKWKDLTYNVMAGFSYENYAYSVFGVRSDNYANSAFPSSSFNLVTSGSNIYANGFSYNAYALESWFARAALNWKDRYVLNASFRTDGSSRFPKSSRFGFFPAASLAWIVSNEEFFPKTDVLDELKFRVSAGQTGSMAGIGNWAAMDLVGAGSSYNGESGLSFSTPAQNLKWEVATKYGWDVDYNILTSTRYLEDASYFKFKTITLSYRLPEKALRAIKSTAAKLFFTVDNAFTITRYDGYDPEVSMASGPASAGYAVDFGYQPSLRSYLFGIQLQF